ncbi:MAG: sensor histidine kinase [Ignavibacteriaceae bacterium]
MRVQAKELENNTVEVVIKDNGIGMPESFLKRIFKVEEKVGRIGTEGEKSTGLGLLLCKEFIEKNGGRIRAESRENIGSTFYFTLHSAVEL